MLRSVGDVVILSVLVLDDVRSRADREFFDIDIKDAIGLILDMGDEYSPLD